MSDHISQSTITQIGEVLKDDGVISNEDLEDGAYILPYSVIQNTANNLYLFIHLVHRMLYQFQTATLDKIQTVLVSDGLIAENSSNSVQHVIYFINYSANNQFAFSISRGAEIQ